MKKTFFAVVALLCGAMAMSSCNNQKVAEAVEDTTPVVYFTEEISPEALVKMYEALGRKAEGRVAVKISTGEMGGNNYLHPELIKNLVEAVNGTIVECNTAYAGSRMKSEDHWKTIEAHGFMNIAKVDIMDEEGDMRIPVLDSTHMKYNIVGNHLSNYDFMINLAHFKGHQMGGFGGVLKNASIGVASTKGKTYIHTAGYTEDPDSLWGHVEDQDGFLESMAAAAQAVHHYFGDGERVLYISVLNNISIDCDCNSHPADPEIQDLGIMASLDPVALDQAAYDMVSNLQKDEHNNNQPLMDRIAKQHGVHILEWAEKIGLGVRTYNLVKVQ